MTLLMAIVLAHAGPTVQQAFPPPEGSVRVDGGGFGSHLGLLTLRPTGTPVTTHDGRVLRRDVPVIDLPLVDGDLQQCADTIIRLRAEWLRDGGREVLFHATSGDPMPWARYAAGETAYEHGGRLRWRAATPATWDGYLRAVFMWAGTASLAERDTVAVQVPRPGDVVVEPGFPGHAVVLLDVARTAEQTWVLVGQGYMPAQSMHIDPGPVDGWWLWDNRLELSSWPLETSGLRRFR